MFPIAQISRQPFTRPVKGQGVARFLEGARYLRVQALRRKGHAAVAHGTSQVLVTFETPSLWPNHELGGDRASSLRRVYDWWTRNGPGGQRPFKRPTFMAIQPSSRFRFRATS